MLNFVFIGIIIPAWLFHTIFIFMSRFVGQSAIIAHFIHLHVINQIGKNMQTMYVVK